MVLRADVLGAAIDSAIAGNPDAPRIYLSPRGETPYPGMVRSWRTAPGVMLLAGRFEGIDERVISARGLPRGLDRRLRALGRRAGSDGADRRSRTAAAGRSRDGSRHSSRRASRLGCSNTRTTLGRASGRAYPSLTFCCRATTSALLHGAAPNPSDELLSDGPICGEHAAAKITTSAPPREADRTTATCRPGFLSGLHLSARSGGCRSLRERPEHADCEYGRRGHFHLIRICPGGPSRRAITTLRTQLPIWHPSSRVDQERTGAGRLSDPGLDPGQSPPKPL